MKITTALPLLILIFLLMSCAAKKPYIRSGHNNEVDEKSLSLDNIDYELYLVGDIGAATDDVSESDIVDLIKHELVRNDVKKSVVFLGNSFDEKGLPDKEDKSFDAMDKAIDKCIKELKDHTDKVYFIPGNTEWHDGNQYHTSAVQHVEHYLESKVNGKNIFTPSTGCGAPKVVELTDDLILILIDSQWVLQGDRSQQRQRSGCDVDDEQELVKIIQETIAKNKMKNVVVAAHHPVHSNGKTGGNFGVKSHLLPLPILGSLITGIRKIGGDSQSFGHPQYEAYRAVVDHALGNFEGIIHASAHDKNLQYHQYDENHYIVAGSGSDTEFVRKGGTADFALMKKGFSKITHTKDLELWLEFYTVDIANPKVPKSVFRKRLYKKEQIDYSDKTIYKDLAELPKNKVVKASEKYTNGKFGIGNTYRSAWAADVEVPLILLDNEHGGLTPVKQGGGFQTRSLRLENDEGQQWVLRSVDKQVYKVVPPAFRKTFISNYVQDGISAAHPYGAMVVPPFAEAVGVYHANPRYVWLPAQKALGEYNTDFSENLYLYEERPGGNMEGHPSYGGAKKSVSTLDLVTKLYKNHRHEVDQQYVVKARLLDLLLGDWDRHDDQWRWGIYDHPIDKKKKLYRAIPRDRDQVFFKNDGWLQYIASRPYITPSIRKFEKEIDFIDGLAFNARHFDRHFLAQLNEQDFITAAKHIQNVVTDDLIDTALKSWPEQIYALNGQEIEEKIKARRKDLVKYAKEFYRYLTKEVTAIGTYGKNVFDVTALSDDRLDVKVYHIDDDGQHLTWSRVINGKDCEELRLIGLKRNDQFNFYGKEKSSVDIILLGGSGDDLVHNESSHLKITAFDKANGMQVHGNKVKSKLKDQKGVNSFDRLDWKLDAAIHFPMLSFYTDEGIGLSYNVLWRKNGFRKNPYKSNHVLNAGYYWANNAFVASYSGHWTSVFGPDWDFRLDGLFTGPTFAQFFYGLGNTYNNYEEIFPNIEGSGSSHFHIVRGIHLDINPHLVRNFGNNRSLSINPSIEFLDFDNDLNDPSEPRFIFTDEANRTSADFNSKLYAGIGLQYTSNRVNSPTLPTRGYIFDSGVEYRQSLSNSEFSNITLSTNVSAYIPFSPTHTIVFATNIGGAYTFGDYEFFHANYLSNQSRLRSFKTNRFAGDGIVYHSSDLRIKILQGHGGLRTGLGIFGSFDYGRAFLENEESDEWHSSYGGGIYLTPLDMIGFKIGYYIGRDDSQLSIGGALSF